MPIRDQPLANIAVLGVCSVDIAFVPRGVNKIDFPSVPQFPQDLGLFGFFKHIPTKKNPKTTTAQ